ncbi:RagB/SusD family nutrient uptake outer membrane protein [Rhabdobacter roseus]|uniref:RagB/SusD family nutrient uptake outer membrane protein n=1 Tax=Rhabdobacter roseus TaxID=1655419 RepID=A0A840TQA4_9BACT|nr:RagB/SusD family nutrient uptake outer membrane protein [Rhabdobacter roseus]MBB5283732.1 hypothetical protein [Rhabdobacter roseus]
MKKILIAGLLLLSLTNCKDYLTEVNKSEILADEYYRTATGYENLVNSAYSSLRGIYKAPWVFMAGTDMYVEGRGAQPEGISEYRNLAANDGNVTTFYSDTYRAIQRCNAAIHYNSLTESTATLPARLGEMKFLRAYYYFLLVQQFGGVSIVDELIDSPVLSFSRNSAEEVYSFVIAEMREALNLVPEASGTPFGRVNKRAVQHYLAKVHLTRGYETFAANDDFAQAASLADAAINGQGLTLSFEEVFWPGNERNNEILFSIQYDRVSMNNLQNDGSNQNYYFGPYMGGEGNLYGYPNRSYNLNPTMYLFDLYTQQDARFEGTFMLTYYERYYDYYDKRNDRANLNVKYFYAPRWVDPEAWRAQDPVRRSATIIHPYSTKWEAMPGGLDNATPAIRKFDDPTSLFSSGGSSSRDVFLARLAETYLVAAEAYLKLNQPATAAERINVVRRRADKSGTGAMQITAADVTIDYILDERARELAGEYHRWFDLKRTGKLVERTRLHNRPIREKYFNNGINPFEGTGGTLKILRPIPQNALDLNQNESFTQNPGY